MATNDKSALCSLQVICLLFVLYTNGLQTYNIIFLHCCTGQVSVQRAMLEVNPYRSKFKESVDGYIEEGIIRRELADNFCYYNENYDKIAGTVFPTFFNKLLK